jgi:hypothetical protein
MAIEIVAPLNEMFLSAGHPPPPAAAATAAAPPSSKIDTNMICSS